MTKVVEIAMPPTREPNKGTNKDQQRPANSQAPKEPAVDATGLEAGFSDLQRSFGNQYVQRFVGAANAGENSAPDSVRREYIRRLAGSRHVGNHQVARAVQRFAESASVTGMGSGIGDSTVKIGPVWGGVSALNDSGPATSGDPYLKMEGVETVYLKEDVTGGDIDMHIFESADINNILFNDSQWGSWDGTVPYFVSGGQITFGQAIVKSSVGGQGATMSVSVGSTSTPTGGYVTFTLVVAAAGSVTGGGSIGVGPISGSAPISTTTSFAGGVSRTFVVNLGLIPPKPITGPDIGFAIGKDTLLEGQEGKIASWFEDILEPPVKQQIRNGKRPVIISGYASTTGKKGKNRDLSESRARKVERILRGHAGTAATINVFFFGEDNATTPDETEDPKWRRATIVADVPNRNAPAAPGPATK